MSKNHLQFGRLNKTCHLYYISYIIDMGIYICISPFNIYNKIMYKYSQNEIISFTEILYNLWGEKHLDRKEVKSYLTDMGLTLKNLNKGAIVIFYKEQNYLDTNITVFKDGKVVVDAKI